MPFSPLKKLPHQLFISILFLAVFSLSAMAQNILGAVDKFDQVQVVASFASALYAELPLTNLATVLDFTSDSHSRNFLRILIVVLGLAVGVGVVLSPRIATALEARTTMRIKPWQLAAGSIVFAFIGLVASGISGSSLANGFEVSRLVTGDGQLIMGKLRSVRSDEWLLLTPLAIAQVNHEPPFPVVNRNLGPDGQNMLVVGMSGVPVWHVSALVRPATWGFFFLDLRRALAWHWWFPVFGCLFAVWGMLTFFVPNRWRLGLGLAAGFCSSAYLVAWSYWPANAVMFPAAAFCFLLLLLTTRSIWKLSLLAVALGLALAGFVLVLYPPWQVTLGYLFLAATLGVVVRDRLFVGFDTHRGVALAFALLLTGTIFFAWWHDAQDAIKAMSATIYPGQRDALAGGRLHFWEFMRGFTNAHTLYQKDKNISASGISSFLYFFPLVFVAALIAVLRRQKRPIPEIAIYAFCIVILAYGFFGFPITITKASLLGRVPETRIDLALGLAATLLYGIALTSPLCATHGIFKKGALAAWLLAGAWTTLVLLGMMAAPEYLRNGIAVVTYLVVPVLTLVLGFCLLTGRAKLFALGYWLCSAVISAPFNPWVLMPSKVSISEALTTHEASEPHRRVLILGSQIPSMFSLAAGQPVVAGVYYYPQATIWNTLDPDGKQAAITNRFQHLAYKPEKFTDAATFRLESPRPDVVHVGFDPYRFDFRLSHAQSVWAPEIPGLIKALEQNPSLQRVRGKDGWMRYDVICC